MNKAWVAILPAFIGKRLDGRQNLQKIIANTGWLFADKILRMGVGLIVSVWMARYLGPDQFGAFNFALSFVALFGAVATLGLDGIVVRDIVREPARSHEIISSAFVLKLGGGSIAFLLTLATIFVMRPTESQTHWLVGIIAAGMIFQSFDAIDLWFQSQVQSKYTVLAKNSAFVVIAVARVVLILHKAPLVAFAYAVLAEIILGACGLILFYFKRPAAFAWHPTLNIARKLVKESWPLILSSLAVMIYMRIDQIMLAQMMGDKEVGLYSAALRFSEIWYFIPTVIVTSIMPSMAQTKYTSPNRYNLQLQKLFNNLVTIAYIIALPMTYACNLIMVFFYGNAFLKAGSILSIHIWTAIFVFMGVGSTPFTINNGLLRFSLLQTLSGSILNIVLNTFLIPMYGGVGAAISTLSAQIFSSFIINMFFVELRPLFRIEFQALISPIKYIWIRR